MFSVSSPDAALRWMMTAAFPWGGILYTGLLSTDLALLIEVRLGQYPLRPCSSCQPHSHERLMRINLGLPSLCCS